MSEQKQDYNFVIQEHQKGKLSHIDVRFEVDDHLIGFTLNDPGRVGTEKKLSNNSEDYSKQKILAQLKSRQPKEWLTLQGYVKPGEVGTTKDIPARFIILDQGKYEIGTKKPHLLEVFLHGREFKDRFLFRKLPRQEELEKVGEKQLIWFVWKPKNQSPYVLSDSAIKENWAPPKGVSAMPKEWEDKIPSQLQWWKKGWTGEKALETIKEARKALLNRGILSIKQLDFTLKEHSTHWKLNFSDGKSFNIDKNPLTQKKEITVLIEKENQEDKKAKILDQGKVHFIEQSANFLSLEFKGSKLKGFWTAKLKDEKWLLGTSETNQKPKKLQAIELSDSQIGMIYRLSNSELSLSQIADEVGCSKSSITQWQKKFGLR
ncbi:MAG: hypothetical protein ACTSPO_15665 [Candidatus Heimdallarchaeaceae archaeon]